MANTVEALDAWGSAIPQPHGSECYDHQSGAFGLGGSNKSEQQPTSASKSKYTSDTMNDDDDIHVPTDSMILGLTASMAMGTRHKSILRTAAEKAADAKEKESGGVKFEDGESTLEREDTLIQNEPMDHQHSTATNLSQVTSSARSSYSGLASSASKDFNSMLKSSQTLARTVSPFSIGIALLANTIAVFICVLRSPVVKLCQLQAVPTAAANRSEET